MTPQEALQLLDSIAKNTSMTRQDHVLAQQAVAVITKALEKDEPDVGGKIKGSVKSSQRPT